MNIDIREHIKSNFKDSDIKDIKDSIESSLKENDEITLPGMGVFFEILWQNTDESGKDFILNILKNSL
jgi:small acid-soluble spore protein I (minor)